MTEQQGYREPTDEQLENFVRVLLEAEAERLDVGPINSHFAAQMVVRNPTLKKIWLQHHRELQESIHSARSTGGV